MGTRNPDVDAWFDRYENPMKEMMAAVRELGAVVRAWCGARDASS